MSHLKEHAAKGEPDWVHGHPHEPNPAPPGDDATILVELSAQQTQSLSLEALQQYPYTEVADCYIVSTGHGTSGPFCFGGVQLLTLLQSLLPNEQSWSYVDLHSADGFGARVYLSELVAEGHDRMSLLAWQLDGRPLSRQQGLVRLIVASEVDDALKQVKWVSKIVLT